MTSPLGLAALASILTGVAAALLTGLLVSPTRSLASRVRPYTIASRTSLGRSADVLAVARPSPLLASGTLRRLFGPPLDALAARLGRLVDTASDERLLLRLRQAGMLLDLPEQRRVQEYRVRQLARGVGGGVLGVLASLLAGANTGVVLVVAFVGFGGGVAHWRATIDRCIEERRTRMRIELYTVNHLLAMHVKVGGGVVQAVQRVVQRGSGEIVDELGAALVAHETGLRAAEAFQRLIRVTPEPNAARTYRLLATGAEWGADLAEGLLSLAEDIREGRREALRRTATKRRAAMLIPIIAVLAPVMLLFIVAPLPSLLFQLR
ncbi:MAG: type II secretion system F family protein [Nitriliruptorales bacterium]